MFIKDGRTARASRTEKTRIIDARRTTNTLRCAAQRHALPTTLTLGNHPQPPSEPAPTQPSQNHTMDINSELPEESAMHQLRFPPFPQVPDGVELIPFHLFRPSGIRVPIDDEDLGVDVDVDVEDGQRAPADMVERDGLGILTIALRVKHATDNVEKKKKRKKKNAAQHMQVAEKPKTWWEIWEEIEEIRIRKNAYDRRVYPRCAPSLCCALNDVV